MKPYEFGEILTTAWLSSTEECVSPPLHCINLVTLSFFLFLFFFFSPFLFREFLFYSFASFRGWLREKPLQPAAMGVSGREEIKVSFH